MVQVEYDGEGFLEKNRDSLPTGANELMQASTNPLIELIFKGIGSINYLHKYLYIYQYSKHTHSHIQ